MKLLPSEDIIYETKLEPEEVLKKIDEITEYEDFHKANKPILYQTIGYFRNRRHKPYIGSIDENSFNIRRIIDYRNSFNPLIYGTVKKVSGKTKVYVKIKLQPLVIAFIIAWSAFAIQFFLGILTTSFQKQTFIPFIFLPPVMLAIAYATTFYFFNSESGDSKRYLAQLLEAEIIESEE